MRFTLPPHLLLLLLGLPLTSLGAQTAPTFVSPRTLPPARGYSQIVDVPSGSRLLLLSGQVPLDSTGRLVGEGDFRAQARQVFENIRLALAARGASFSNVVKLGFYVLDTRNNLPALRSIRDQYINAANPPASTLVQVSGLFRPDVLLEVEVMAVVPR